MNTAVVILAGGKSRRMGRDKLALMFEGTTLLGSAVYRFKEEFEDVYISVDDAGKYDNIAEKKIVDILPGAGPLSGLHAALAVLPSESVFLVAADLPFATAGAAKRVIELCGEKETCIIELPNGKLEPLFGCYRKSLLSRCEEAILAGDYRMTEIILGADSRLVTPYELGTLWDEKLITNINYPEDYENIFNLNL